MTVDLGDNGVSLSKLQEFFCEDSVIIEEKEHKISGFLENNNFNLFEQKLHEMGYSFSIRDSRKLDTVPAFSRRIVTPFGRGNVKIPFVNKKRVTYLCSQGKLYYRLQNQKNNDHTSLVKKRRRRKGSIKLGCPSRMTVFELEFFPEYALEKDGWRHKKKVLGELASQLSTPQGVHRQRRLYASVVWQHNHCAVSPHLNQKFDDVIRTELKRIVHEEKNTNLAFVKSLLRNALRKNRVKAVGISRSFFPNNRTIRGYIYQLAFDRVRSKLDQERLSSNVDEWAASAKVFYRPYRPEAGNFDSKPMLFCYEADWHHHILSTYGEVLVLDAAYRTLDCPLPLYFLAVRTNATLCPVGFFVVQHADTRSVSEALDIFREWNARWRPRYFTADFSEAEINAINTAFWEPNNANVKIGDFYRRQAWERWLNVAGNLSNDDHKEQLLRLWNKVAASPDKPSLERNLNILQYDEVFVQNTKAQQYFVNTWLAVKEFWVVAFFEADLRAHLTNDDDSGVGSAADQLLQHSFLREYADKSLHEILEAIIVGYIPRTLHEYEMACAKTGAIRHKYDDDGDDHDDDVEIPAFVRNRPLAFRRYVGERYACAKNVYRDEWINVEQDGGLSVRCKSDERRRYVVRWEEPSCECQDFQTHRLPCEHICAVTLLVPEHSFESLPLAYRRSTYCCGASDAFPSFGDTEDGECEVDEDDIVNVTYIDDGDGGGGDGDVSESNVDIEECCEVVEPFDEYPKENGRLYEECSEMSVELAEYSNSSDVEVAAEFEECADANVQFEECSWNDVISNATEQRLREIREKSEEIMDLSWSVREDDLSNSASIENCLQLLRNTVQILETCKRKASLCRKET